MAPRVFHRDFCGIASGHDCSKAGSVRGFALLACAVAAFGLLGAGAARAQSGLRLSSWRVADGLPSSTPLGVTLSPRGNVLTTHDATFPVARLDGFAVTTISNSVGAPTRVYEGRSGRLWCAHVGGLLEFSGDEWELHAVSEIAQEFRLNPLRAVRPIPLLPIDHVRVLVLLPDRLIEYHSGERRTTVLRLASETGLGRFNELNAGSSTNIWVSGNRGVLEVTGPLRQLAPGSHFTEFPLPEALNATDLQRPFEDSTGAVVCTAEDAESHDKIVLRLRHGRWERWNTPVANLRQAWTGPNGELWGHSAGALVRFEEPPAPSRTLRSTTLLQVGRIADVAVEPNGISWLATSDGLLRAAPLPWRMDPGLETSPGQVLAVTGDRRGRLVVATGNQVHWLEGRQWQSSHRTVTSLEDPAHPPEALFPLPDGEVLVFNGHRNEIASPTGRPRALPATLARSQPLGSLADGRVLFLDGEANALDLVSSDGNEVSHFARLPEEATRIGRPAFVLQSRRGELWIGGESGLLLQRGDTTTLITDPDAFTEDGALCGLELSDGRLVFGGFDAVREFDGRNWRTLRRSMERVHALQTGRDGSLWVASGNGLHRFKDNGWLTLGEDEGLPPGAVFAVFEDAMAHVWAGTARGLAMLDPGLDPDPPRALIASADVPERSGDDRALFVVGGEDCWKYTPAGRLLFSWRLDNGGWSNWRGASSVQFTNLTAGTHRFQVRCMDPCGNQQVRPTPLEFSVSLPWFKDPRLVATSMALALVVIAMAVQAALNYSRLKRSYAEVERQVAERSAALEKANAELLHSQKMTALGTLAAGIAHDFNNLLSIIRGSSQLLEQHLDDPEKSRQRLQRIRTAVDQGAALVRAMLGYSRGTTAQRRELEIVEVVQQAIRLLDERLQARVQFVPPPAPLPRFPASSEMLQQILLNLMQNADEATEHQGMVRLVVGLTNAPATDILKPSPAATYVDLTVSDQGMGIPRENLSRIFEPFFTTKALSSRRGTGLGLSMVYEFAKEMGAGLSVTSTLGHGSTFRLSLPVPASTAQGAGAPTRGAGTR